MSSRACLQNPAAARICEHGDQVPPRPAQRPPAAAPPARRAGPASGRKCGSRARMVAGRRPSDSLPAVRHAPGCRRAALFRRPSRTPASLRATPAASMSPVHAGSPASRWGAQSRGHAPQRAAARRAVRRAAPATESRLTANSAAITGQSTASKLPAWATGRAQRRVAGLRPAGRRRRSQSSAAATWPGCRPRTAGVRPRARPHRAADAQELEQTIRRRRPPDAPPSPCRRGRCARIDARPAIDRGCRGTARSSAGSTTMSNSSPFALWMVMISTVLAPP